ncbi:pirin family protein [Alteromonas sp. K632G]|jgi:redox-sensitive bicupin YhaK (pirin superfamily)|uniref:pirin family protein n=1 Tax=Alteromonas sp. K632G TaxID=2820757 RepID=UPI000C112573|nr:pirin family protein [Alteromonas sp. K632G]MBO7922238.1 pirin family protein [Alteromonas sp. K632G]PHS58952.1 MAG: pirin family protein [Alteromonas sp.]|tara:strand:+ start:1811 stop:2536 length:726 start_codon:yes stop_codon:yes gene_type:complete
MQYIRKGSERGNVNLGWLNSKHSFSFGQYYDANHMGFSALRVFNDDIVQAGRGFETHGHRDMEIISFVVSGALKHKDSTGNDYVIPAGDIQVMSAGKGIRHSEMNASDKEEVNFIQIWIEPNVTGVQPAYLQKSVSDKNGLELLVSESGQDGSLKINQDARISKLALSRGESFDLAVESSPTLGAGYLHIVKGELTVNDVKSDKMTTLTKGDAIGLGLGQKVVVLANEEALALWFDLPPVG